MKHETKQIFYTVHEHYHSMGDNFQPCRFSGADGCGPEQPNVTTLALKRELCSSFLEPTCKSLAGLVWIFYTSEARISYEHIHREDISETLSLNSTWQHVGCSQVCALSQLRSQRWLETLSHDCASAEESCLMAGLHLWALSCVNSARCPFSTAAI